MNPEKIIPLKKLKNFLLDTLFPIMCISCGRSGCWICKDCLEKITILLEQKCPICEKSITPNGYTCFDCRKKYRIDGLLVASSYQNRTVSKAIHLYKYRFVENIDKLLGEIMLKAILASELPLPEIIIPIPLHPRKLRWRGFNQAELLARYLSEKITPGFPIPLINDIIARKKYTHPQMKIKNYQERQKNMKGAFEITRKNARIIKGRRILIVDDVATTGATVFECAETLKRKGAGEVYALVLARQEFKK